MRKLLRQRRADGDSDGRQRRKPRMTVCIRLHATCEQPIATSPSVFLLAADITIMMLMASGHVVDAQYLSACILLFHLLRALRNPSLLSLVGAGARVGAKTQEDQAKVPNTRGCGD
eukprot:132903-Amphidinium_carterae.1